MVLCTCDLYAALCMVCPVSCTPALGSLYFAFCTLHFFFVLPTPHSAFCILQSVPVHASVVLRTLYFAVGTLHSVLGYPVLGILCSVLCICTLYLLLGTSYSLMCNLHSALVLWSLDSWMCTLDSGFWRFQISAFMHIAWAQSFLGLSTFAVDVYVPLIVNS